jgi:hypothetical protein
MPKKIIQDMVRIKKKGEPVKKVSRPSAPVKEPEPIDRYDIEYDNYYTAGNGRSVGNRSRYGLWVVAAASVLFLLFSFSVVFSGATVAVSPRVEELALSQNFSAVKDGSSSELPFDLVVISGEENKTIEGGEEEDVSTKAVGTVILYNAFGSLPQRLNIDTRLEGSNGKIYKTKKAIVVPGMKGGTPGSVEVEIYAAEAGTEYNSSPLDFKILGFKGTPKYEKFYGRSKGDIKGGFSGKQRQVSDVEKAKLLEELKSALKLKLSQKARDQMPPGFILFKDAVFLTINEENFNSSSSTNMIPVSVKGTLYGILFEEKALTKKIMEKSFPSDKESDVYIKNIRDFSFSIPGGATSEESNNVFENLKAFNFHLSGTSSLIWRVDEAKLANDILGKKKKDFNQILSEYPNIASANLSLRPFWKRSLPEKKESIKVVVNYPK